MKALMASKNGHAVGGDDWDELDELDVDELLNMEDVPVIETETSNPKTKKNMLVENVSATSFFTLRTSLPMYQRR
ncbi:hypothetical protein PC116_g15649 [Phytophthora cactorum]|uniref:Uncharacterized protein n=1 Tax=Phytophthora cactorum TaxID=29920 RepID=A0A8T1D7C0_9STRA|nr:hypothetical protein PC111_g10539 [Phytophthora cactorum]KAG2889002.1 hypothetical protein PC115_g19886 [Phytophthora cactorum]KAG2935116.1 hypothetical protein PC117_g12461 [Phytophthora cactorum]KAG3182437.1 hypothetical protein PC128_g14669 [Phytophthora cactorum]KAG4236253.1 hypothetical protein PC116_g15649 [Phytophthora cactorum]